MKPNETQSDTWQALKPGSLIRFASRENARVTRRRLIRVGGLSAALVVAGILVSIRDADSTEPNYGGIRCSVVRAKAEAHLSGQLDAATDSKIAEHLQQCSLCASFMKQAANRQANVVKAPPVQFVSLKSDFLLHLPCGPAAIDDQVMPGDIRACVGCQE
jgi:hypothetical protein